jgi:hypothetical protein
MRVLHVVDGVLVALLLRQLEVEVDPAGEGARAEEPAHRIGPDLGHEVVQLDELAGPLAHADGLTVADEAHP